METTSPIHHTLLDTLQRRTGGAGLAKSLAAIVLGTALITLCAKINVPVWPVPVTLQSLAIAVLAAAFGLRVGLATVALYLLEGAVGLPVFATGGGLAYIAGPTGGFLLGFLVMTAIVGFASDRGASGKLMPLFGAMLLGNAVLLVIGFAWLVSFSGAAGWINEADVLGSAFAGAIKPFLVWDLVKMVFAALTAAGAWKIFSRK